MLMVEQSQEEGLVELREAVDYITNHTATWTSRKQLRLEMAKRSPLFFPQNPRPQSFPISFNSDSILEFLTLFLLLPTNKLCQVLWAQHAARTGPLLLFQPKPGPCSGLPAVLFLFLPSYQPDAGDAGQAVSLLPDYHLTQRHVFPNLFGVCRPARRGLCFVP